MKNNNLLIIFSYCLFLAFIIIIVVSLMGGCSGYTVCGYEDETIEVFESPMANNY